MIQSFEHVNNLVIDGIIIGKMADLSEVYPALIELGVHRIPVR